MKIVLDVKLQRNVSYASEGDGEFESPKKKVLDWSCEGQTRKKLGHMIASVTIWRLGACCGRTTVVFRNKRLDAKSLNS